MKSSLSLGYGSKVTLASLVVGFGVMAACSATPPPPQNRNSGGSTSQGGTGTGLVSSGGSLNLSGGSGGGSGGMREPRCDDAGVCTCINVLVYGRMPTYGAMPIGSDTTLAFQNYLNTKSSATVTLATTYQPLTPEYLANYDVIILQALENAENMPAWPFTAEDKANFETWVRAGGGVIALTGYGGNAVEVDPTNALLAFSGLQYAKDDVLGDTCNASTPAPGNCCYCAPTSYPLAGWNPAHPISANLTNVGAYHGRSVTSSAPDAQIVAQGPLNFTTGVASSVVYGATRQVDAGRVFMFADEWVTYTSQWFGATLDPGAIAPCQTDMGNVCYGKTADKFYTVPQFWYNTLLWLSGDRECFTIDDPVIVF
jgi:hypothetical protein